MLVSHHEQQHSAKLARQCEMSVWKVSSYAVEIGVRYFIPSSFCVFILV